MIMELIYKATVNREIEREKAYAQTLGDNAINSSMQQFYDGMVECCNRLLNVLNTLEVKEVDLDKEIDNIWNSRFNLGWDEKSLLSMNHEGFTTIVKHFYELGLKAKKGGEE